MLDASFAVVSVVVAYSDMYRVFYSKISWAIMLSNMLICGMIGTTFANLLFSSNESYVLNGWYFWDCVGCDSVDLGRWKQMCIAWVYYYVQVVLWLLWFRKEKYFCFS